ncbi:predicted protein [Phaeodactylum tricornutum CCAP 1055/1]|uniref:Uncharacterized protein n=5 Tax=Phaeodactylum tricornutum TaxID=2850 RepID=B7FTF8_PHATC|nr:predicted protein [Phaeodactylum tricornutum CCAP 1055/1]EEC50651.1 predicted protein [Phaeodactylum tricornutum CCAP 1055/1]|eukprot:XP_002177837.1 predicted protein [Phaeodactylum tricornutum CCAP 1055/1]
MTFPFILDGFQQQAVVRLERSESVFVAAHTSAGKTVVAEYAVALAKQRGTRCVYTSPIKALSNQKFRDFSLKFGAENIGLITGDLQVNADDSTCLIMTTEILRSMLYRGADLVRDIEFVVFDEVHYVNDTERGVVWEEVIIMLPSYVNLIFLSATTPNTLEFSDWIGRTKRKPVFVIKTDYRPVPLSFNLWAGLKLHTVMEGRDGFLERGFASAANALLPAMAWQAQGTKQNWMSLVRFLDRENMTPTVVFSFSKKKCEEISIMLQSLDLNTAKERGAVQGFTLQTVARLSKNDSNLPQVVMVCEMVQRGIGIHHGGLLPILKEMVEILFAKSLVKILFATETFAMGVNMPARSVVFNSVRKHDGKQFRQLEPGEITQMAGRAGRRGLDKVGTVIICCFGETPPPQPMLKQMLTGSSTRLNSRFRLTYNMILNLLRVEEMSVESMIKRSFSEFATQRALTTNDFPQLLTRGIRALENRIGSEDVEEYFSTCSEILSITERLLTNVRDTEAASFEGILQKGRIVLISACRELGAILLVSSQKCNVDTTSILREEHSSPAQATENPFAGMKTRGKKGASMDNKRGSGTAKADEEVEKVLDSLMEAERAELYLRDFLKRGDSVLRSRQLFGRLEAELDQMRNYEIHRHPSLESMYSTVERKESLRSKVNTLRHLLSNESLQLFPDFLQRKAVLRKLGYIDEKETVSIKGRVACETNTCEELIVTELVFEGLLNELDPEEIVAVLSALVFQEKGKETSLSVELPERLITIALNLGRIQKDVGLDIDPAEYSESSLNFGLVHVVYEWALGVPFKSICDLTDVQEGSIVRSITRLDELCREVRNCARVVGNPTLYRKLEAASMTIKRDIVFASSLYVS